MSKMCETCKHWKRSPESYMRSDYGSCESDKFVYSAWIEHEELPDDGLEYGDYEGYSASFTTASKFGCVHHEVNK